MNILTLNVGSSSLKFGFYQATTSEPMLIAEGSIDTGSGQHTLRYRSDCEWKTLAFDGRTDSE